MKGNFIKKSLTVVAVIIILVYVGFQLYSISFPKIKTEIAQKSTMIDSIETLGYIVRDEEQISTDTEGILNFVLADGEKIEKGGVIAEVYKTEEDILAKRKLKDIDSQIKKLNSLGNSSEIASTSPNILDKQVHSDMNVILKSMNDGNYKKVFKSKNKLLYLINQRQLIVGKAQDFSKRINLLSKEKEKLTNLSLKRIDNITTDKSGYFVNYSDGMENILNYKDVGKVSTIKVRELIDASVDKSTRVKAKLVNNAKWYILSNVKTSDIENLNEGQYVKVYIPRAGTENIDAKVVAINLVGGDDEAAVVLECSYINSNILAIRREPITINISEYLGIRIDKRAIHERIISIKDENDDHAEKEKRVKGVYTVCGKQLVFKEIKILYSGKNYVICSQNPEDTYSKNTLEVYDEIVIEGTDLYDRKIIK